MKNIFPFIVLSILSAFPVHSQNPVEIHLTKVDPDIIGQATVDQDEFLKWVARLNDEIDKHFTTDTNDLEVISMFTLSRDQDLRIQHSSRPGGEERNLDGLKEALFSIPAPRAKYVPYTFMLIARINYGCPDNEVTFQPEFDYPSDKRSDEFSALSLSEKVVKLREWVSEEVLPLLAYYESIVDVNFSGVRGIADDLEEKKYLTESAVTLTELNSTYWNAILEMSTGYQLIPFTKVCLHIMHDEYPQASRLLKVISLFSNEDSLPFALHDELYDKLGGLMGELKKLVDDCSAIRRTDGADSAFKKIEELKIQFPKSPQVVFEYYMNRLLPKGKKKEWAKANMEVSECDRLFYPRVVPSDREQAYRFSSNTESSELFRDPNHVRPNLVSYADIALDLGEYGLAAQTYWLILNYFDKENDYNNRDILAHFLYCLNKLGHSEILEKFKGDFTKKFEIIDEDRECFMKDSEAYKNWKKK